MLTRLRNLKDLGPKLSSSLHSEKTNGALEATVPTACNQSNRPTCSGRPVPSSELEAGEHMQLNPTSKGIFLTTKN